MNYHVFGTVIRLFEKNMNFHGLGTVLNIDFPSLEINENNMNFHGLVAHLGPHLQLFCHLGPLLARPAAGRGRIPGSYS